MFSLSNVSLVTFTLRNIAKELSQKVDLFASDSHNADVRRLDEILAARKLKLGMSPSSSRKVVAAANQLGCPMAFSNNRKSPLLNYTISSTMITGDFVDPEEGLDKLEANLVGSKLADCEARF